MPQIAFADRVGSGGITSGPARTAFATPHLSQTDFWPVRSMCIVCAFIVWEAKPVSWLYVLTGCRRCTYSLTWFVASYLRKHP